MDAAGTTLPEEPLNRPVRVVLFCGPVLERGMVRFATPLLGSEEWPFICEVSVSIGDRVTVADFSGNTLIVKKS